MICKISIQLINECHNRYYTIQDSSIQCMKYNVQTVTVRKCSESFRTIYLFGGFYVAFNTVQVISQRVVGRAEETSIYSSLGLCTVNCRPTASNYQLSHLRPSQGSNPGLRGGRRECYHSATVAPCFRTNWHQNW